MDKLLKRAFERGRIKSTQETPSHLGTILEGAAAGGDLELINALLDYGAPIEGSHDMAHWSPLNIAAGYGQLEVVKLLVSRGANPNSKNKHDNNPICSAAYNRDKSIVYFLLSQGARVDDVVEEGNILLHIVCEAGWIDMAPMLITGRNSVMALNEFQRTPLHFLAGSCFFDKEKEPDLVALATLLIGKGSDVVAQDYEGKTPLHLAARCGNNSIAAALISAAASAVTMQDKHGQTSASLCSKSCT